MQCAHFIPSSKRVTFLVEKDAEKSENFERFFARNLSLFSPPFSPQKSAQKSENLERFFAPNLSLFSPFFHARLDTVLRSSGPSRPSDLPRPAQN